MTPAGARGDSPIPADRPPRRSATTPTGRSTKVSSRGPKMALPPTAFGRVSAFAPISTICSARRSVVQKIVKQGVSCTTGRSRLRARSIRSGLPRRRGLSAFSVVGFPEGRFPPRAASVSPFVTAGRSRLSAARGARRRARRRRSGPLHQVADAPPDPGFVSVALVLAGAPRRLILARAVVIREAPAGPCRRPISARTLPRQPIVGRSAPPRVPLFQPPISAAGRPPGPLSSSPKGLTPVALTRRNRPGSAGW